MSKYTRFETKKQAERPWKVHPIWRGIGCLLIIIIPLMGYAAGMTFKEMNAEEGWIAVPADLDTHPNMSKVEKLLPALKPVTDIIEGIYVFDAVLTGLFTLAGFALLSIGYSFFYRIIGPPRYGPTDAPPIRRSAARRSR